MKSKGYWCYRLGFYNRFGQIVLTLSWLVMLANAQAVEPTLLYSEVSQLPGDPLKPQDPSRSSPLLPSPILPFPEELLKISPSPPLPAEVLPLSSSERITVSQFIFKFDRTNLKKVLEAEIKGEDTKIRDAKIAERIKPYEDRSLVFNKEELEQVVAKFLNRPISFAELLQARTEVTKLYTSRGYITSGAYIPQQATLIQDGKGAIEIRVVEGVLEETDVTVNSRNLEDSIERASEDEFDSVKLLEKTIKAALLERFKPLNRDSLLVKLQLLQADPRIEAVSLATLSPGSVPGTNKLSVTVVKRPSAFVQFKLDNGRSPVVGSFRQQIQGTVGNAGPYGFGDPSISASMSFTKGTETIDASGSLPLNSFSIYGRFLESISGVIEPPFDELLIDSPSRYYEVTGRYRVLSTPKHDVVLGVTLNHQRSSTSILGERIPLLPGGDGDGLTQIWALRFLLPEWTKRGKNDLLAFRSQLSLGLNIFGSALDIPPPNSRFVSWRGQVQWIKRLAPETLFIVRADAQLADRPLVPLEQFGVGGRESVRGYRQDFLLTDNGVLGSVELRLPILRIPAWRSTLYLNPFFDYGIGWNSGNFINPNPNALAATGFGLHWHHRDKRGYDRLVIQLDWGIPLVNTDFNRNTLQDRGIYLSIFYNLF